MALSDAKLRTLIKGHDGKNPKKYADRDGLAALVRPTGKVSFIFRYRYDGKPQTATLGEYPSMSLAEARQKLDECKAWLNEGRNPNTEFSIQKQAIHQAVTVQQALEFWIDDFARANRANADKHLAQFQKHIFPFVGKLPVEELDTRNWVKVFDDIRKGTHYKAAPVAAGYIFGNVKQALIYCRKRHYCITHALDDLNLTDVGKKQGKKDRVLTLEELKDVWNWVHDIKSNWYYRNLVRLLIVFGARTQEIRLSKVSEWDIDAMLWTCPKSHSKNGKGIVRPIPEKLKPLIESLVSQSATEYLLGELKESPAVSMWGAKLSKSLGHDDWRLHDLRRTFATHLNDAGIEPHVIESLLGHTLQGVAGIYNRAQYIEQKRKALDLWLSSLDGESIEFDNVKPFERNQSNTA